MVIDNVFGRNSATAARECGAELFIPDAGGCFTSVRPGLCGMHGHLILLHFEPNKLSLQCALCGYASEGWEVGRPLVARRQVDNRALASRAH